MYLYWQKASQRAINVIFRSNYCRYCETLMEKSKSGKIGKLEHLSFCTRHKVHCSHNHDGSPQAHLRALFLLLLAAL